MESVTTFLEKRLKLKVNREKSAVDRPSKRKFLGFRMFKYRDQVRIGRRIEKLNTYLRGWLGYFSLADTLSSLRTSMDGHATASRRAFGSSGNVPAHASGNSGRWASPIGRPRVSSA
jgi:hypothetical protein